MDGCISGRRQQQACERRPSDRDVPFMLGKGFPSLSQPVAPASVRLRSTTTRGRRPTPRASSCQPDRRVRSSARPAATQAPRRWKRLRPLRTACGYFATARRAASGKEHQGRSRPKKAPFDSRQESTAPFRGAKGDLRWSSGGGLCSGGPSGRPNMSRSPSTVAPVSSRQRSSCSRVSSSRTFAIA